MIRDARVLRPEFVPREVEHRNAEVNALSNALRPIVDGEPGETTLLLGPSGAGKTCVARHTVERLRENVLDFDSQYVNCWQDYTRFRVLYEVLDGIGRTVDVHRQSTPTDELLDRIRAYDGPQCVVVLDEVDQLEEKTPLYDLYRARNISLILIANREEELFAQFDDRLTSRFHSSERVQFDKYRLDELVSILDARARWALAEDAVGERELALVADAAAGDARVAIAVLRNAARRAEQSDREAITADVVNDAVPEGRREVRRKAVEQLHPHQRALYEILDETDELSPGDLYEEYASRVDEPKTKRTVRNYLSKMSRYGLVVAEGEKRARTYRPR